VDIDGVNVEHGRHNSKLIEILVKRINVKTQKLSINILEKTHNNKEFKFPSMLKLFESESNLVDYNIFHEDYDKYNGTKTLI
jgi:hypothetical protein